MGLVYAHFSYSPGATTVHTPAGEVLRERRGVCQDFAHVMIAMCRSLGIPALYVSGYLYNGPKQLLRGPQASHAWCEVYVPGFGWRGLDPTNGQPADGGRGRRPARRRLTGQGSLPRATAVAAVWSIFSMLDRTASSCSSRGSRWLRMSW